MMNCVVCTFNCARGSRVALMDDCDGGEWSPGRNTCLAPFFAVLVRSRHLFEEKPLFMLFTRFTVTVMVNEIQMEPHFMVAALILGALAQSFFGNGKCTMLTYLPAFVRVRELEKPAHV